MFAGDFLRTLDNRDASVHRISVAICGLGRFAAPFKRFGAPGELALLLDRVLTHGLQHYTTDPAKVEDAIRHLPSLLTSLANIVDALEQVPTVTHARFESVLLEAFVIYRELHPHHQRRHTAALSRLLIALERCQGALAVILPRFVFQALSHTCAGQEMPKADSAAPTAAAVVAPHVSATRVLAATEEELVEEPLDQNGDERDETFDRRPVQRTPGYRVYRPLWHALLTHSALPAASHGVTTRAAEERETHSRNALQRALYDSLVEAMLRFLERLDLGYAVDAPDQRRVSILAGGHDVTLTSVVISPPTTDPAAAAVAAASASTTSSKKPTATDGRSKKPAAAAAVSVAAPPTEDPAMLIDDDSLTADIAAEEGQLRVELAEAEALAAAATDPQRLRAEKEADMLLFLNLVRLAEKLLPYTLPALVCRALGVCGRRAFDRAVEPPSAAVRSVSPADSGACASATRLTISLRADVYWRSRALPTPRPPMVPPPSATSSQ
jgi:hypothetical protein